MNKFHPYFSKNPLDRLDQIRKDSLKVEALKESDASVYLLFDESQILVDEENRVCIFNKEFISSLDIRKEDLVLLGEYEDKFYFAATFKKVEEHGLKRISLRDFVSMDYLQEDMFGILAQAASVLNWHITHTFCSTCGKGTMVTQAGWRRDCLACKKEHFPRVDSAVIMLVTYGDYCLLGRGVNFKEGRYSCLAGYVESGESFENAARRELFEEAGVIGLEVEYLASQPWPFPSTIMIGMHVKAQAQELSLDKNEIEDAFWVHKDEVKAVLEGKEGYSFSFPKKFAIARDMLEYWVNK